MSEPLWRPGMELRDDWLAQVREPILDPDREIVDPHHHLWQRGGAVYELDELCADTRSGHNVVQTVFIECRSYYDTSRPEPFQPVGETETVARMATDLASRGDRPRLAGIVAFADLAHPDLAAVLDAHETAGQGLFCGIRHAGAHAPDPQGLHIPGRGRPGQYRDPDFRRGLAVLGERGLPYDTWHYHFQAEDFLDMVRAVPGTTIVLDHCGTPVGVGRFAGQRDAVHARWKDDMARLAERPNVVAKLGGMAMPDNGWGWHLRDRPAGSDAFADIYGPWYRHMIDLFGPDRCMFESNFPVDRTGFGYAILWNGFKMLSSDLDDSAQTDLFSGTARRVYGL